MSVLRNARHERFAQALAAGKTATAAYAEAGFKPNRHNAAHLASTNQHIKARVAAIQARAAERAEITLVRLTDMLPISA